MRGMPLASARRARQPREDMRVDCDARHAAFFQRHCQPDDRRATGASQARRRIWRRCPRHAILARISGVVYPALARPDDARLDRRQMRGKPLPHLLHEGRGIVEQAIDQIDALAVEALRARCEPLARDLGG